ncbi:hypothetical protein WD019_15230 [Fictibacillus sp. Mic-4]|uniref:hypothetical protein n=1 Tax=Fictibacillus TaxID=1329200 RepID=UPI0004140D02|nr:hypothetical protein [Fictibacillus gelatini]
MAKMSINVQDLDIFKNLVGGLIEILKDERIPFSIREEYLEKMMPNLGLECER